MTNPLELSSLRFLYLDCQTTGLGPGKGAILELGWSFHSQGVESRLVQPPPEALERVPKTVWRMTGLVPEDLSGAPAVADVWKQILEQAAALNPAYAVIHYAQFETPFLRQLHESVAGESDLPWKVLCTHRMAKRVFPDLPAHTLRALSGHFGFTLPEEHRSPDHVAATQVIWKHLLVGLKAQGVESREDLERWLASPTIKRADPARKRKYLTPRQDRLDLPLGPGVYEMLSLTGEILYIGKATCLRDRVNSYYRQRKTTRTRLKELMTQVGQVKVTETATPLEAALLENDRIKSVQPPYNELLRTRDRRLFYFSYDLEQASPTPDASHHWGPFTSQDAFDSLQRLLWIERGELENLDVELLKHSPEVTREALEKTAERVGMRGDWTLARLLHLGRRLPKQESKAEEETPEEAIHRKVKWAVRRLHHARWLCWLTESDVSWKLPTEEQWRHLRVRGGRLVENDGRTRIPFRDRQARMDLECYDRMRILSTELGVMAKKGAAIRLKLGVTRELSEKDLLRLLGAAE